MADEVAATTATATVPAQPATQGNDADADRLATLVLFAEFDIDKGSTLRESYPAALAHYSPEFFADVMLPEGVHNRKEDFTVFFLNRQSARKTRVAAVGEEEEAVTAESDPMREFMYCLSVVHTIHDASARRGATVKAVALCSRHKCCFSFRGVLDVAVAKVAEAKTTEEVRLVLEQLYTAVNSVDVGGIRSLSDMERRFMKRTVSSTGRAAANAADAQELEAAQFFRTKVQWQDKAIPLQFKLCSSEDQHDSGLLTKLLLKFGEQTMAVYNAVLTGARVLILGYNQPAGEVCNYVLSTSSLVCPPLFGLIHRQFPYANLTDLGFLSTPGYIAGVTNPMFKTKKEWWDVLCDISMGEVVVSTPVEKDDYEGSDRAFVQEVLDGIGAGYDEEWVRCMFEEYTRKNVVDIAMGEANYMDEETQVKRTAMNNKRITKWARTDNYKLFTDARKRRDFFTPAFNTDKTGVDLKKHIRSLQGDMVVLDDAQVERIYADFVALLATEQELQEFLSHLPVLRGGLQTIAQGIFHPSIGVKYNTVVLLKRLEAFPSTASSLHRLNAFLLMSYQRIHSIVAPEQRS